MRARSGRVPFSAKEAHNGRLVVQVARPRLTTCLAAALWALSLSLWGAGLLLWLSSATRHIPPHTGPVAASLAASEPRVFADVAHIEIPMWSAFLVLASLGALIGKRQPRNPLGLVLASAGVLAAFRMFADGYAAFAAGDALGSLASDAETVVWVSSWLTYGPIALIGPALLLSPQGRLPGARWRPVLWLQFASLGLL